MKFLDLFAGIGGFRKGLEANSHKCVGFCEIDKFAKKSYKAIFNTEGEKEFGDITKVSESEVKELGQVDVICAGFPCQAFSIAGERKGFEDTRGTLFFEVARFTSILKPKYVFCENVKGLLNHDKGRTIRTIINTMNELGYFVNLELLNSKDFGVPQNRERVYLICMKADELTPEGLINNLNTSKNITESYLLGLLQKNLSEVKKLQGTKTKEWVLNYLILKDIIGAVQKQDNSEEIITRIQEIILMNMNNKLIVDTNQNIEELLKRIVKENLDTRKLFTILVSIKEIMNSDTSLKVRANILNVVEVFQKDYQSFWDKVLLNLTLVEENTKYAKISDFISTEEQGLSDWLSWDSFNSVIIKKQDVIRYLGEKCGRGVLPTRGETEKVQIQIIGNADPSRKIGSRTDVYSANGLIGALLSSDYKEPKLVQVGSLEGKFQSNNRVYSTKGLAPTIKTMAGGNNEPKILIDSTNLKIRKITPLECWRLQGFTDEDFNKAKKVNSKTQLYKEAGNSVTVNVIKAIASKFFEE